MAKLFAFPTQAAFDFSPTLAVTLDERTSPLGDHAAREAALDIRRSWIVEAPAGSGKTGLLIQRFLKLLAFGAVQRPGEVLAITFTRKAAAELRNRVLEQLTAAAERHPLLPSAGAYERETRELALAVLARDGALGWRLLEATHALNISTIDALCAQISMNRPLLSAGAGRYRPVDDPMPLYEAAAERTILELGGPNRALDEALRLVLLHRDAQIHDVVQLIAGMLRDREQWGKLVPFEREQLTEEILDSEVRPRLELTLAKAISGGLARAAGALGHTRLAELARFAARLGNEPGYKGEASPMALCSNLPDPPGCQAEHLDHWLALLYLLLTQENAWRSGFQARYLRFDLSNPDLLWLKETIAELQAQDDRDPGLRDALSAVRCLPPARYPEDQWRMVKALFRILRQALAELNVLFAERGVCDFSEIALTARTLLRTDPEFFTDSGELTHLLVDEMQDTSAGQYELLEMLTRSWDGATQTVFLVGDPKQSIYLFRQARVARFLRTQATGLLGDLPLGALRLTANFRSQADLVNDFNETFGLILPRPEQLPPKGTDQVEVPFVAAEATRPHNSESALQWHTRRIAREDRRDDGGDLLPQPAEPRENDDARAIRFLIEDFRRRWQAEPRAADQPRRAPTIAVLARSRAHLTPILSEFKVDRGSGTLPLRAIEIEPLKDRPEILDLLSIARALLHPGDRVAWLAVLRSPVCGLELADLLALCGDVAEADPTATVLHLVERRRHLLSPAGQKLLDRTWPILAEAQGSLGMADFSTVVERTWRSLGADAILRVEERSNAERFLSLLRKLEAGLDPLSLPLLERSLEKLYAEPATHQDAVDLLTIHKAKGLEWDLVLVPALHRETGTNHHELLRWLELDGEHGGEAEVMLSPIGGKGEDSSKLSRWLGSLQASREDAEAKRLFYVACTRAREELHLFAAYSVKKSGELIAPRAGTLLRAAWPAAAPLFRERLAMSPDAFAETSPDAVPFLAPLPDAGVVTIAAAADLAPQAFSTVQVAPRTVYRLPATFRPLDRFQANRGPDIPRPSAAALRHDTWFQRPDGSFPARAFGNVLHRFLDFSAERLAQGQTAEELLAELPGWSRRLQASFRSEGLPPAVCVREADRARQALENSVRDRSGRWVLSPHTEASSERSLQFSQLGEELRPVRSLRADRTFLAGPQPYSEGLDSHLWIVDFKTTEQGGRELGAFLTTERSKYEPQMHSYAQAMLAGAGMRRPVMLALFYPLLPHLLYWPYTVQTASDNEKHRVQMSLSR